MQNKSSRGRREGKKSSSSDPTGTYTSLPLTLPYKHILELLKQRGEQAGVIFHGCREQLSPAWFSSLKCFPPAVCAHPHQTKTICMQRPVWSCCSGAGLEVRGAGRSGAETLTPRAGSRSSSSPARAGNAEPGSESGLLSPSPAQPHGLLWGRERTGQLWHRENEGVGFGGTTAQCCWAAPLVLLGEEGGHRESF